MTQSKLFMTTVQAPGVKTTAGFGIGALWGENPDYLPDY
jgi:hypothetical protein